MAITKRYSDTKSETFFAGRVLEVRKYVDRRNMSDTLDYTDYRDVECTEALVWLGTHAVPPYGDRTRTPDEYKYGPEPRDLEFHEQFGWVDCSNHFTWRGEPSRTPTVDADLQNGEPLMWANFIAWKAHTAAETKRKAAELQVRKEESERRAAEDRLKDAARKAKAAAKDATLKAAAEALLTTVVKGNTYTVDGFTGQAFWVGAKKYRGKWQPRVGLKNSRGEIAWIDASKLK